jgi:hypothetical protein
VLTGRAGSPDNEFNGALDRVSYDSGLLDISRLSPCQSQIRCRDLLIAKPKFGEMVFRGSCEFASRKHAQR